jgi:hypothetical protein
MGRGLGRSRGRESKFWVVAGAGLSGTLCFPNIQTTLSHKQKIVLPPGTMLRKLSGECNDGVLGAERSKCRSSGRCFKSGPGCVVGAIASHQTDWIIFQGYISCSVVYVSRFEMLIRWNFGSLHAQVIGLAGVGYISLYIIDCSIVD